MKINSEKLFGFVNNLGTDEKVEFRVYYDDVFTGMEIFWDSKNFIWESGKFCSGMFFDPLYNFEEIIEEKSKKIELIKSIKTVGCNIEVKIGDEKTFLSTETMQYEIAINKINELVSAVNYLLEKSGEDG